MTRQEFITTLKQKLSGLPQQEIEDRINFYTEIIDDKIEEGKTEEEAIAEIGEVDKIALQIISETSALNPVKETSKPKKKLTKTAITLLIIGSPLWISLLASLFAVVFVLYASLWAVVVSLWTAFVAFAVSCPLGIILGIFFNHSGNVFTSIAIIGMAIICGGLAILTFIASKKATAGSVILTKKILSFTKNCFTQRGDK